MSLQSFSSLNPFAYLEAAQTRHQYGIVGAGASADRRKNATGISPDFSERISSSA
jgi:hypothetical protein